MPALPKNAIIYIIIYLLSFENATPGIQVSSYQGDVGASYSEHPFYLYLHSANGLPVVLTSQYRLMMMMSCFCQFILSRIM